jgi:hypothetical protein
MLFLHQFVNTVEIADIHLYETVIRFILNVLQIGQVASVSKLIEVDDPVIRVFVHEKANNMTTDKTGTACDDYTVIQWIGYYTASPRQSHARDDKGLCYLVNSMQK